MTPLRLAVIGAGHLGRIHARLTGSLRGASLVAIADVSRHARDSVADELGVQAVDDYRKLIGEIDAAILATPTSTHCEIGCELLEAGVPLLVEKPLASSVAEADKLVELAERAELVLQVGHVERFNPAFEAACDKLHDIRYISSERLSGYPARSTDVGVVLDLMIHDLDIVLATAGSPVQSVDALGVAVVGPHEDIATARLRFEDGCIANLTASRVSYVTRRAMQFYGAAGHVAVDFAGRQGIHVAFAKSMDKARRAQELATETANRDAEGDVLAAILQRRNLAVRECNPIAEEQREFVESVRLGRPCRVPGTAARDAIGVAEQVLQSIANHEWDGSPHGRIGPDILPAAPILRPGIWPEDESIVPSRRVAG